MEIKQLITHCSLHAEKTCDFVCSHCKKKLCYECIGPHVQNERDNEFSIISIHKENMKAKGIVENYENIMKSLTIEGVKG